MIPKTPYLVADREPRGIPIKADDREFPIAHVELSTSAEDMSKTADFIVRACNSHKALVSALRDFAERPGCEHVYGIAPVEMTGIYCRWCAAIVVLKELDTAKTTV